MQFKKNKAILAAVLAAGMASSALMSVTASAARTAEEKYGTATYAQRFMSLYDDVITNGKKNGYLDENDFNGNATTNPKGLVISPIEAANLPNNLPDVDAAVINGNYALGAGLPSTYPAIFVEVFDEETSIRRTNFIVVKEGNEASEKTQALVKAIQSDEVAKFIESNYKGSVIQSFLSQEDIK